jgi:hypothetical protein
MRAQHAPGVWRVPPRGPPRDGSHRLAAPGAGGIMPFRASALSDHARLTSKVEPLIAREMAPRQRERHDL